MKKNIFITLSFFMLGFGLVIGLVFPLFVVLMGVSETIAYNLPFILLCICAGLIVGVVNILLARVFIGRKLSKLSKYMNIVNQTIKTNAILEEDVSKTLEKCTLCETSTDTIGDNARAFDSLLSTLFSQFDKQRKIRKFSNLLNANLEMTALSQKALRQLVDTMTAKGGALAVENHGKLEIKSSINMDGVKKILDSDIPWESLKNNRRQYITIPEGVMLDGLLANFRPSHTLIEPIVYKDVVIGLIILANTQPFDAHNLEILEFLANNLGMAINNAITHDQLANLAAKDPLTDMYNRRFGISRLREEYSRSIRSKIPLGIAMMDIDHFKRINDTYGHLVGDKVIIEMAHVVQNAMREGDVAIRYGGEEFLLVLPGASIADCVKSVQRIRRLIEDMVVKHLSHEINFTVSIGVASYPENNIDSIDDLINNSDKALYIAKENGRNQVVASSRS